MVVAEVPLWVVHSTASATGGTANATTASPVPQYLSRATESIAFLDSAGARQKCAIYSIDIHPDGSKFATGGGDGTVRLWNSAALFRAKHTGGKYKEETNAYASTSAPSSNEEEESELDEKSSTGGGAVSSAVASADEEQHENVAVHDLNQLVRRKKDGSTPTVSTPVKHQAASSNAAGVLLAPSPQQARESHHRLLCTMSAHTGSSVLCVRFSTSGDCLASAGDDAAVCIYAKGTSVAAAAGNLDQHHVEQWSRIKLCRGHTLDAVGLAWAPDDSHLVSCSLDSDAPIIVWKLTDLTESNGSAAAISSQKILCHPYKILGKNIHTSTVKGVTFDPAGTYLASSGDDPAVCIWRAHDDWGLEKRIDDGIFRKWKDDERELSSQTLFRRLSWSTDGSYICSTNGTVKNKHVAATISRDGWSVSGSDSASAGAANLVGHKQPVVVSRHCPQLLEVETERDMDDEEEEPDYATMVALGDKHGYVTVWSTRKSRPIFRLQCSESRCTVTDLAWGRVPNGDDMMLLVSLLDGQVVALKFGVPSELGPLLSTRDQKRVFQLQYGIDLGDDSAVGRRRMFVGDHSAPRLIENALQFALEEKKDEDGDQDMSTSDDERPASRLPSPNRVRTMQSETQSNGKKRIRPVLMGADGGGDKRPKNGDKPANGNKAKKGKKKADPVAEALESAERAASAAEGLTAAAGKRDASFKGRHDSAAGATGQIDRVGTTHHAQRPPTASPAVAQPQLPHSTSRIHSVDLPTPSDVLMSNGDADGASFKLTADCTNIQHVPKGSSGQPLSCAVLSISRGGKVQWKDEILGTSCSAIAAESSLIAVGTSDGTVYLYGTAPTLGWASGTAFRSHAPLVLGQAVIALQLVQDEDGRLRMLVATADGSFGVYTLLPECKLIYKGSILPAMTHMSLSTSGQSKELPRLARIQITGSDHLFLVLSLEPLKPSRSSSEEGSRGRSSQASASFGVGGALQAFVYHREMELWLRVSDSRFLLSDFYSTLPAKSSDAEVLGTMDNAVKSGAVMSSLKPSRRIGSGGTSAAMYHAADEEDGGNIATRSHCEDRLACALALKSSSEFQSWLVLYVRMLATGGHADHLRFVVDLLLGAPSASSEQDACWWLSSAPTVLGLDRKELVKTVLVPEMSKNRALQRLTNEIAMEL